MLRRHRLRLLAGLMLGFAWLSGCALGPDHQPPSADLGTAYAHAPEGQWVPARPALPVTQDWWLVFDDSTLASYMQRLDASNPDLAQAEAQYRQARFAVDSARSALFPGLDLSASVKRSGQGGSGPQPSVSTNHETAAAVSWEIDLWGRVRRNLEAAQAQAQASDADLAAVRLSLQVSLAQTYFAVRASLLQDEVLARTLDEYSRALELTRNRQQAGIASLADVAAARAQLEQARAQKIRLAWQREQLRHALAALLGMVPAQFAPDLPVSLPDAPLMQAGLPSTLLQHRPDIVAAERRIAEANARIGVAQAAWFPDLTLGAQLGYRATEFASWITAPARFWTLGPALALRLFDAGERSAALGSARAAHDAQSAAWRKTVLDAMREVEDALVQSQALVDEQSAQEQALAAARESLRQTVNQYQEGLIDYLSVVQAQVTALNAEQNSIDLRRQRLEATVQLIAALGGGWPGLESGARPLTNR